MNTNKAKDGGVEGQLQDQGRKGSGVVITVDDIYRAGLLESGDNRLQRAVPRQVPEESKDAEYYAARMSNTNAARKSRMKKRKIDETRVEIIKRQKEVIEELEDKVKYLESYNQLCLEYLGGLGGAQEDIPKKKRGPRGGDK